MRVPGAARRLLARLTPAWRIPNATDTPEARIRIQGLQEKLGLDSLVPTFDYTRIGETYAAFDISQVFAAADRAVRLTRANVLSWNDIRGENVIFIGPPKFNSHLAAITGPELTVNDAQVINAHPRPGESATYERTNDSIGDASEDYALMDSLPGIDSSTRILSLEGGSDCILDSAPPRPSTLLPAGLFIARVPG